MTYFRSEQNRSRLRPEILAAFCFNRSGRIQEKASYIADIQGFLLSIRVSFWPLWSGKRDSHSRCARVCSREQLLTPPAPGRGALRSPGDEGPFSSHISTRKGRTVLVLPVALERKTDFRPKHIPCSQSAHYEKHFPQRSLP